MRSWDKWLPQRSRLTSNLKPCRSKCAAEPPGIRYLSGRGQQGSRVGGSTEMPGWQGSGFSVPACRRAATQAWGSSSRYKRPRLNQSSRLCCRMRQRLTAVTESKATVPIDSTHKESWPHFSSTTTLAPFAASCAAVESPPMPLPMITASYSMSVGAPPALTGASAAAAAVAACRCGRCCRRWWRQGAAAAAACCCCWRLGRAINFLDPP